MYMRHDVVVQSLHGRTLDGWHELLLDPDAHVAPNVFAAELLAHVSPNMIFTELLHVLGSTRIVTNHALEPKWPCDAA